MAYSYSLVIGGGTLAKAAMGCSEVTFLGAAGIIYLSCFEVS